MNNVIGMETMESLSCEHISIPYNGSLEKFLIGRECIIHILSGKATLVVGGLNEEQWKYPLDPLNTIHIPPSTNFSLLNAGVGALELAFYKL